MKYNDEKTMEPVETDQDAMAKEIGRKIMNLPQNLQTWMAGAIYTAEYMAKEQMTGEKKAG